MANIINQTPFLRSERTFPTEDPQLLKNELDDCYIDISNAVNARTIGLYASNKSAQTGDSWFVKNNQQQQTFRQVYVVSAAGSIAHGLNLTSLSAIVRIYGTVTDGSSWYPLPYVDIVAANQISVKITSSSIVITAGAGAPAISSGYVVVEWLSFK